MHAMFEGDQSEEATEAKATALAHLHAVAEGVVMAQTLSHIMSHVNAPALQEAVNDYHQCIQAKQIH
jgi:3-dehydroquinate synthetase